MTKLSVRTAPPATITIERGRLAPLRKLIGRRSERRHGIAVAMEIRMACMCCGAVASRRTGRGRHRMTSMCVAIDTADQTVLVDIGGERGQH